MAFGLGRYSSATVFPILSFTFEKAGLPLTEVDTYGCIVHFGFRLSFIFHFSIRLSFVVHFSIRLSFIVHFSIRLSIQQVFSS